MGSSILEAKMDSNDYFIEKKIEIMMDMQSKRVANELNSIKEAVSSLSRELSEIKKHVSESRQPITPEPISHAHTRGFEASSEPFQPFNQQNNKQKMEEAQQTQAKGQTRYGEYQPKDVSIEKFFYSGSNRK